MTTLLRQYSVPIVVILVNCPKLYKVRKNVTETAKLTLEGHFPGVEKFFHNWKG